MNFSNLSSKLKAKVHTTLTRPLYNLYHLGLSSRPLSSTHIIVNWWGDFAQMLPPHKKTSQISPIISSSHLKWPFFSYYCIAKFKFLLAHIPTRKILCFCVCFFFLPIHKFNKQKQDLTRIPAQFPGFDCQ